ncbi:ARM repeat-containing protein [Amylostereum chailletii]|nr:ARM repeat-containing protein [Amylostereum chailletii]
MDLQTLSNLFATTLDPNPNVRKAGELEIRKIGAQEGLLAALLQIIASDGVDLAVRQACAIYVKNRVQWHYASSSIVPTRTDQSPLKPSDRTAVKTLVLPLLSSSPSTRITSQLQSTLKTVIANEFPKEWPELMDTSRQMLGSNNISEVRAGCVVVLEIIRAFRFSREDSVLPGVIEQLFPILANLASHLLTSPPAGAESEIPVILHYILKTYRNSITLHLSRHQQSPESLKPWGTLLFQVVNLQIPSGFVPEDPEERERSEWWKAKKWAYNTLGRLFHRFGNPSQLPSTLQDDYGVFAEHFITQFAPEIFKVYLQQVELCVSGQAWISNKCQYHMFQFFTECVKPKSTWGLLKPHFQILVSQFAFPHLSFTPTKQALWDLDPVDFIRTSIDVAELVSSPVAAATSFLLQLVQSRTKATFMPILAFVNSVLASNPSPSQRYGALNITATLAPLIVRHPEVKGDMETFLIQHVLPTFASPEGYLRYVGCAVVHAAEMQTLKWSSEENMKSIFQAVAQALDDPELHVRVQAALALTEMISAHEQVKDAVAPQVEKVIHDLLKLSDETDLDILNNSMENMVEVFQDELLPVAVALASRLCNSYIRLARESVVQEERTTDNIDAGIPTEGEDDKTYAAMGVAKTIGTIVSIVDENAALLAEVQEVVIPIIVFSLENKVIDLFDNMYDLVDSLTFRTHAISPNMWPVFELTYKLFKSDAVDFLDEMLPALDNFVSYGSDIFKARPDYRHMMLDIYTTSITSKQLGENDRVNGSKLAESLLLNLRGQVDELVQPIIATAVDHMEEAQTSALRLAHLEVLINAVLYNPAAALQLMEQHKPGTARAFFDKWFGAINADKDKLPRVHDKKLTIMALCSLMEIDPAAIPPSLQDGWQGIVGATLKVFKGLPKAIEKRKALETSLHEYSDTEESDGEIKLPDADDEDAKVWPEDVWDEDSAYIEMLAKEGQRLRQRAAANNDEDEDEDEDDESDDEEELEEELGFISPLETVNPYSRLKLALNTMQAKNVALYQAATTSLDVEQQTLLMELMRMAEQHEAVAVGAQP